MGAFSGSSEIMPRPAAVLMLQLLLGTLALVENGALLVWGAVGPWRYLAAYPSDGGFDRFLILTSCLMILLNLAMAAACAHHLKMLPLLIAMTLALPLAVVVLLTVLNVSYLDSVIFYLALLPSAGAILVPYLLLLRFAALRRP